MHAALTVTVQGDQAAHELHPGQRLVIGRGLDAGIRLEDDSVSRSHAALTLISTRIYLTDLGSRHGTWVDGDRLHPGAAFLVLPSQEIRLGPCTIRAELVGMDDLEREWALRQLRRVHKIVPADRFEILGKLGSGSLGRVWAAVEKHSKLLVAIKVLRVELEPNEAATKRFVREAHLLSEIESPFVVAYHGTGSDPERPYLVTELVHGPSVKDRLDEVGTVSIPEALRIGEEVARGLHAIQRLGIIHRDVKPQNILLSPGGAAKLTDFGIAKSTASADDALTRKGLGLGTLCYLAPEQGADARSVGSPADLFGLGATLYHLIGGRPPRYHDESDTDLEIHEVLQNDPISLRRLRPDCPQQVATLVHDLLQVDPSERPQPALHVATELASLRSGLYPDSDTILDDTASQGFKLP